jgi:hypothetical protein
VSPKLAELQPEAAQDATNAQFHSTSLPRSCLRASAKMRGGLRLKSNPVHRKKQTSSPVRPPSHVLSPAQNGFKSACASPACSHCDNGLIRMAWFRPVQCRHGAALTLTSGLSAGPRPRQWLLRSFFPISKPMSPFGLPAPPRRQFAKKLGASTPMSSPGSEAQGQERFFLSFARISHARQASHGHSLASKRTSQYVEHSFLLVWSKANPQR